MSARLQVLSNADAANAINQSYKYERNYGTVVRVLVDEGFLDRSLNGGFYLTNAGRRQLALLRSLEK